MEERVNDAAYEPDLPAREGFEDLRLGQARRREVGLLTDGMMAGRGETPIHERALLVRLEKLWAGSGTRGTLETDLKKTGVLNSGEEEDEHDSRRMKMKMVLPAANFRLLMRDTHSHTRGVGSAVEDPWMVPAHSSLLSDGH